MREHVVAASKAMRNGDWKKARDFIINDKMNAKVNFIQFSVSNVFLIALRNRFKKFRILLISYFS